MNEAEVDAELRGERARHQLRERQAFLVVRLRDPLPVLDQVPVHVAHKRHRPAEPDGAELRHVADHLPQRIDRRGRDAHRTPYTRMRAGLPSTAGAATYSLASSGTKKPVRARAAV